jgi:hypothetical protein
VVAELQLHDEPHLAAAFRALTAALHLSHRRGRKPSLWVGCFMFVLARCGCSIMWCLGCVHLLVAVADWCIKAEAREFVV